MNTTDNRPNPSLEQRARALYLEAARQLDGTTAGRLRAARREALASAHATPRSRHVVRWLVPSDACAAIALAAVLAWPAMPHPNATAPTTANVSSETDNALPPDPEQADPNLYQNLDFYGWLAANGNQPDTH